MSQTRSSESIPDAQQDPLRAFFDYPEPSSLSPVILSAQQGPLPQLSLTLVLGVASYVRKAVR